MSLCLFHRSEKRWPGDAITNEVILFHERNVTNTWNFKPRPDDVWRVTRPDEGVAQRPPLRIFKSKSRRVKIQTALERSRRTLQDTIMLTLFFDL